MIVLLFLDHDDDGNSLMILLDLNFRNETIPIEINTKPNWLYYELIRLAENMFNISEFARSNTIYFENKYLNRIFKIRDGTRWKITNIFVIFI